MHEGLEYSSALDVILYDKQPDVGFFLVTLQDIKNKICCHKKEKSTYAVLSELMFISAG